MTLATQTAAVAAFRCLGDACEDTCCVGWGMQVTRETVDQYQAKAPELLTALEPLGDGFVMKRDTATDYCVKFDKGWCGIHRDYGDEFLGDACHFFPRITRHVGDCRVVTATPSCPEIARLTLYAEQPFSRVAQQEQRAPHAIKQVLPEGMSTEDALIIHDRCVEEAANSSYSAEMNLLRLVSVVQSLDTQPMAQWNGASAFYFRMAEGRIPEAEPVAEDPFNLTHALHGLILAGNAGKRPRLAQTRDTIAQVLGITFSDDPGFIATAPDALTRALRMMNYWKSEAQTAMQPVLTRYVQAQLSAALFPFAGLGSTLAERITIIAVRFATVKLALMAEAFAQQSVPDAANTVRIVQSLSRLLDHLADPAFSLQIYRETGWMRESRLRALLMV